MMKNQKGITLVALVITIIVLLILAGVSIAMLTDKNSGILTKSQQSVSETEIAEDKEAAALDLSAAYTAYMDAKYVASTPTTDDFVTWLKAKASTEKLMTDEDHYTFNASTGVVTTKHQNKDGKTEKATVSKNGGFELSDDATSSAQAWSATGE